MSYDNCWVEIGDPICCADGGAPYSGSFGGMTADTYNDGNMTWKVGIIDAVNYLFHPCVDTESLQISVIVNVETIAVPYRSELGVVKASQ